MAKSPAWTRKEGQNPKGGLNGASNAFGAPTTLAANGYARLRFVQAQNSWYRIG